MAKRKIKEQEIVNHLKSEGFKEVSVKEKKSQWYKKASERPTCLAKKARFTATKT